MNCRVIATYFGPRRNHNNANKSILNYNDTIDLLKDTLALEKSLSSVDLTKGIEEDDETDLSGELACAGGVCEIFSRILNEAWNLPLNYR